VDLILRLTTLDGHLVQGAPSSAGLADLVLLDPDQRVHAEAERLGVPVARWVDDVAFSGDDRRAVESVVELYASGLSELGLRSRRTGTMHHSATFLGFNLGSRPSIPKAYRRKLEGEVYRASRHGCTPEEWDRISSKVSRLTHLHPRQAKRLRSRLGSRPKASRSE
jgi:RNA-directed DNA polymerase